MFLQMVAALQSVLLRLADGEEQISYDNHVQDELLALFAGLVHSPQCCRDIIISARLCMCQRLAGMLRVQRTSSPQPLLARDRWQV
jgi:hypothetical protein